MSPMDTAYTDYSELITGFGALGEPSEYFKAAWCHAPWGMAAIDTSGNICAVNPAFERCTGLLAAQLIETSEAALDAQLKHVPFERRRVEFEASGLRAIHYIYATSIEQAASLRLADVASELRESLASIYGFTELLLTQHYDDDTRRELTTTVLEQIELMSNTINKHLDQAFVTQF